MAGGVPYLRRVLTRRRSGRTWPQSFLIQNPNTQSRQEASLLPSNHASNQGIREGNGGPAAYGTTSTVFACAFVVQRCERLLLFVGFRCVDNH